MVSDAYDFIGSSYGKVQEIQKTVTVIKFLFLNSVCSPCQKRYQENVVEQRT